MLRALALLFAAVIAVLVWRASSAPERPEPELAAPQEHAQSGARPPESPEPAQRRPAEPAAAGARARSSRLAPATIVQVLDEEGTALSGVPIAVRDPSAPDSVSSEELWWTAGSEGLARLEDDRASWENRNELVHVAAPGFESVGQLVDRNHPPKDPVQLKLGPYGSVAVRVHDSAGHLIPDAWVALARAGEAAPRTDREGRALPFAPTSKRAGLYLFDFVALGQELHVSASSRRSTAEVRGRGPERAGEEIVLDLDLGQPELLLSGRLVDDESRAIADCSFLYSFRVLGEGGDDAKEPGGGGMQRTDAEGKFHLELPSMRAELSLRPRCDGFDPESEARVLVDGVRLPGPLELGDVPVQKRRALASGRAVDDQGEPVARAIVAVEVEDPERAGVWLAASGIGLSSSQNGAFTVVGLPPAGAFRLRATQSDHLEALSATLRTGAVDVVLTLPRASAIRGRVLRDDPGGKAMLWARVVRHELGEVADSERERARVETYGSFQVHGVRPGRCDLELSAEGEDAPLWVIAGIELAAGEQASDSRLAAIDLRGRIRAPPAGARGN